MKHKHSEENKAYDADTGEDNDDDGKDIVKENNANISKRYDGFGHFSCDKFGQLLGNKKGMERHIIQKSSLNLNSMSVCIV